MNSAPDTPVWRSVEALRRRGEAIALARLAQRLLAAPRPVAAPLARRLVAQLLECGEEELCDPVHVEQLRRRDERVLALQRLAGASFTVVDLETSGLSRERCEILEIGAVRVRAGVLQDDEFETLVAPSEPVPQRISELTGIDAASLAGAPELGSALARFRDWLRAAPAGPLVAHNANFDAGFLRAGFARCGLERPNVPVLCTRALGRRLFPEVGRYSLDHLCAHFGVSNRARHRALGDARAAARVLVELCTRAQERGVDTLGALFDLAARPPEDRRRGRATARSRRRVTLKSSGGPQ